MSAELSDEVLCVDPKMVDAVWPYVHHLIYDAISKGNADYDAGHIYNQLKEAKSLLWVLWDHKKILAAMTTEVGTIVGTEKKICTITAFGGDFERCRKFLGRLYQHARDESCEVIRLYGRPGWIRALRDDGFTQPWVALEKRL